jgi:small subunit ribosomal protein S20
MTFVAVGVCRPRRIHLAHSLSAIKRVRQNEKRRVRNRGHRTRLRTQIKKLRQAIEAGNAEEAKKLLPGTVSLVDVMVKKGVIHRNAGSRYKSRLSRRLAALAS